MCSLVPQEKLFQRLQTLFHFFELLLARFELLLLRIHNFFRCILNEFLILQFSLDGLDKTFEVCLILAEFFGLLFDVDESRERGACFRFRLPADQSATRSDEPCRNPVVP